MTLEDTRALSVDVATLRQWRESGEPVELLDVRTAAEYEGGHIPGSVNIPLGQLPAVCGDVASRTQRLVVTCQAGPRSEQAAQLLRERGCSQVQALDGGLAAWQTQGGEVEKGRPLWSMERQVRFAAGSLVIAGVLTSMRYSPARFFSGAIGTGLVISAVTNTCTMARVLSQLPHNRRSYSDIRAALDDLAGR